MKSVLHFIIMPVLIMLLPVMMTVTVLGHGLSYVYTKLFEVLE